MSLTNTILKKYLQPRINRIHKFILNPDEAQNKILIDLISKAVDTEWGKKYNYEKIKSWNDYIKNVPISSYEEIFPCIERIMNGEQNILWPSEIKWFSKSSGTTNAKSKFIPVSKESLKDCHYRGGMDMLSLYFNNNPKSKLFSGKGLAIGGSLYGNDGSSNSYYGDISAVIMANLPLWAQYVRTPDIKTALMGDWEEKTEKIARYTIKQNVTNISGVPTWTIVLLEKILAITGKKNMLEVWPNFEVFFHGAVAFTPYKPIFDKFFPGSQVNYIETYNASEGFFGMQDQLKGDEMLLMLDYGIFYEFIPMDDIDSENPTVLRIQDVELQKSYAMIITTNAGLWRYKIGDTVKFTSLSPYRIKITGRTKHFINAFGEELIIENAETAISRACERTEASISNFTVAPIFLDGSNKGGHEWIIEFTKKPADIPAFTKLLDQILKELNSDYEAKRHKDLALQLPVLHCVEEGSFYKWMKKRGKLGGQNKVPRLYGSREYVDDLLSYLNLSH